MSEESGETRGRSRSRRRQSTLYQPKPLVAGILLVLFVATIALVMANVAPVAVGGGSGGALTTVTTAPVRSTTIPPKSQVRVQVANGTSVTGLAHRVTAKLQLAAWDVLPPLTGPATPTTEIYYLPGFKPSALQIAHELSIAASALTPWAAGASNLTRISPAAGTEIVVLLGPDYVTG